MRPLECQSVLLSFWLVQHLSSICPVIVQCSIRDRLSRFDRVYCSWPLPYVHVFHTIGDLALVQEGAIERDNIGMVAIVHDLKLAQDLLPDSRLGIDMDHLDRIN